MRSLEPDRMIDAALDFLATSARLLDRHRGLLACGRGDARAALRALDAYRNPDGGYGWALEPDLRAPSSQPVCALHAFEVLEAVAPRGEAEARALCEWLERVSLPDGALPFALAGAHAPGTAPFWTSADPAEPSLHMTAEIAGIAMRVIPEHPWVRRATDYVAQSAPAVDATTHALTFRAALRVLDQLGHPERERLVRRIPPDGRLRVEGGAADEALHPLDLAPQPGQTLIDPALVEADLDRLRREQLPDGGWDVDWAKRTPAAALEWRGWATVRALTLLLAHERVGALEETREDA